MKKSDLILCEDTRVSIKLLEKFEIKSKLFSNHKFNEKKNLPKIIDNLKNGQIISLISDAGTPGISDPGAILVKECVKEKINIQQRIFAQAAIMFEPIDIWVDKWYDEQEKFNPKGYDFGKHLRNVNCTQAHARKIRDWLDPELLELQAASNPPSKADRDKMNEHDKDDAEQLIEAYSCYTKKALEKKVLALQNILGACNVIIETAKANRKPRKRFRSKEKMVAKMKFAQNNDKFALASINPQDIINASELWVFNFKTRKIGRYVAKTIDPLHQGREGSGLSVKGTTIRDYNEELSVQKTLRKPAVSYTHLTLPTKA